MSGESLGEVVGETSDEARRVAGARWPHHGTSLHVVSVEGLEAIRRKMDRQFRRNRRHHAYHEAGHAVIARRLGIALVRVAIGPVMFRSGGRFHPDFDSYGETTYGSDAAIPRNSMVILTMAGPMAEYRSRGRENWRVLNRRRMVSSDRELVLNQA